MPISLDSAAFGIVLRGTDGRRGCNGRVSIKAVKASEASEAKAKDWSKNWASNSELRAWGGE